MQSEFSDGKKRREEENPQTLASPEHGSEKRTRRRRRKKNEDSNEQPQVEVCPKPLVHSLIPIEENAETTAENSNPTPKKKKKNNVQGEQQLQTCDSSIVIGVEPEVTKEGGSQQGDANGNGGLCPKPLLDTLTPVVPQEENAETFTQNPSPTPRKRKKKKNVQGAEQLQTCDPSILMPDVTMEEGAHEGSETAETTTQNPDPTPKKNKKKNVQGAQQQLQACDPSITIGVEPDVTKEEGAQQGSETAETIIQNPDPTPKKKKKKNVQGAQVQLQTCDPSILIGVELDVTKEEGAQQGDANETAVPGINEEHPLPDSTPSEDTPRKKKSMGKKKNALKPQGAEPEPESKESDNTEHPQQCSPDSELKIKMKKGAEANAENSGVCPKPELAPPLDIAISNDSEVNKRAEPTEAKVEDPQACSKPKLASPIDLPAPINPDKKKEAEPIENPEVCAQSPQPQPCSVPSAEPPGDPTTPINQSRRKRKNKRGKEKIMCSEEKVENQGSPLHMDITLNQAPDQVQQDQATPICLQPASLTDQTIPVDPAIPIDPEQTMKKKKKKQRKNALEGEEPNDNKHYTELPEISIQTSTCPIEAPPVDPAIPMDPCLAIPICPAISTDPEQEMSKKKKKRKSALKSEATEPNEHNSKLPEAALPEAPVQKSIYPIAAPSIDPIIPMGPSPPVDTETPIDQGLEMTEKKRKRKKKRRSALISEGTEPNEHDVKPPETPVQRFVYPIVATTIDPTIPIPAPPIDTATPVLAPSIDTATPIDQGQKTSKKKRKRSALISEGAEPNEHDVNPLGTPVQRSIYPIAEPSIDPTIPTSQAPPVDPATPVDPEQMTKKKRKRKRNSALKNEGLESEKHNADPTAETPVQKTEGSTAENSMGRCNAKPAAKTPVQRTDSLRVTKSPFKQHGESSLRCRACRQPGHEFQQCQRLKCLSMDEEVCFFCGEIGHSLGKCDVSQAGGGRFAKCLLCFEHGHFSYNCPQNSHGINPKVLAVNGAINRTVEAQGEPLAEV